MYCWTKVEVYFTIDRVCSSLYIGVAICLIHVCTYNILNWGKRGCESKAILSAMMYSLKVQLPIVIVRAPPHDITNSYVFGLCHARI